jgi:hypothetical protein
METRVFNNSGSGSGRSSITKLSFGIGLFFVLHSSASYIQQSPYLSDGIHPRLVVCS